LKFTLSLDAFRIDDPDVYAVSAYHGWSNAALFGTPVISADKRNEVRLTPGYKHLAEGYGVALKSEYDLGWANLTSYTAGRWDRGYENTNELAAPFPTNGSLPHTPLLQVTVTNADWHYYEDTYSQEFNLGSKGGGPFDWTAGLFAFRDATSYNPFHLGLYGPFGPGGVLTGGAPDPTTFLFPASAYVNLTELPLFKSTGISESIAGYFDVTYNWNDWHFTLGARYAKDIAKVRYISFPSVADEFYSARLTNTHNFYAFTPRAVVRYSLTPHSSVYASYSEGTKSGIFNGSGYLAQQAPVDQERIRDVEAGYKLEAHGLRFEASAFHYNYSNLQVATYIGGASFFQNAPKAKVYGFDAHLQKTLTEGLTLDTGVAYTHARYTDFKFAAYQFFSPVLGEQNTTRDVSGNTLQRAPEFTGYLTLDYKHELMGGTLDLNATGSYQTISYFDFANTLKQPSHGIVNLRADWTDPSSRWTVSLIGQNVTDTSYLIEILPNAGGFGAAYGRPVSVTGQVSYRF
jgi:iron complex outermembrane receptor protein